MATHKRRTRPTAKSHTPIKSIARRARISTLAFTRRLRGTGSRRR